MSMEQGHRAGWPQALRRTLGVSIVANVVWEMLRLPLYTVWTTGTRKQQAFAHGSEIVDRTVSISKEQFTMMYDRFDMYVFGPVHMLLLGALLIIPFWQLFSKAGYSGWWSFLMIVPVVNVIALYVLAFSNWPALAKS